MTIEEAKTVAKIVESVDSNCSACVASFADELQTHFPQFRWLFEGTNTTKHTNTITVTITQGFYLPK